MGRIRRSRGRWRGAAAGAIVAVVAGTSTACGGSGGDPVALRVIPSSLDLDGGESATSEDVLVRYVFEDGSTLPLDADDATWTSDDPDVATVSGSGHVTGGLAGRTTIRVAHDGLEAVVPTVVRVAPVSTPSRVPVSDVGTGLAISSDCVAIDTLGRIHVVWFDSVNGTRYARSLDGGASFEPSVELLLAVDAPNAFSMIACSEEDQDDVYVTYVDSGGALRCMRSADGGATWPGGGAATGLSLGFARSVAVRDSTVLIVRGDGVLVRSTDFGQTFAPSVPVPSISTAFADVLLDPRGAKAVVASDSPLVRVSVSPDEGATFGPERSDGVSSLFFSDFAIDQIGNVFGAGTDASWLVFDVDAETIAPLPSSLTAATAFTRSIAVDGSNHVHVTGIGGLGALSLQTSVDQGQTVGPSDPLDSDVAAASCAASFSFAGAGVVYVRSGAVFYMHGD